MTYSTKRWTASARRASICGAMLAFAAALVPRTAPAEVTGDYAQDLAQVYGAHQRILAIKDACDKAVPKARRAADEAYAHWKARNRQVLEELDQRVTAMIRGASRDERELARNVGKYEGEMLRQRRLATEVFLEQPEPRVARLCKEFPGTLASPDTDLKKAYAAELRAIREQR